MVAKAAVALAMTAASSVVSIMQASAEAKAIKAQGEAQAQLVNLQYQREAQQLESQALVTRAEAKLQAAQSGLTNLEGVFARVQRQDEANTALRDALMREAAINSGAASGMVDLGHVPTLQALKRGYEDFATATEAGDIQFAAKRIQAESQLAGADILGYQADIMDEDGNYIVDVASPYHQQVIRTNASNQARIVRRSGVAKAFGTMAGGAFQVSQLGGWNALTKPAGTFGIN
jgi:hypothetical protein